MADPTLIPKQKVVAATIGSAVSVIVIWALKTYAHIDFPPQVQVAVDTIIAAVVTLASGWAWPPGASETTLVAANGSVKSAFK